MIEKMKQIKKKIVQPRCLGSPVTILPFPGIIDGCLPIQMWVLPIQMWVLPIQMWVLPIQMWVLPIQMWVLPLKMKSFPLIPGYSMGRKGSQNPSFPSK
jgi:hypothetical protein